MDRLRLMGYWRDDQHPELPDPTRFVDPTWDEQERHVVSMYLASGTVARTCMGYAACRICGKRDNGDLEYTDGVYLWPSGLVHYVDEHGVRLPASIVEHAVRRMGEIEGAEVDGAWWISAGPRM